MNENTPEPWTEAELRDQFACYEGKGDPWSLDRYNQYGVYFDRAIAKIKAEAWEEGHQAGWEEHENPGPFVNDYWDSKLPNPYKEES